MVSSTLVISFSLDFLNYGTNNISQNTKNALVAYFNHLKQNNNDYVLWDYAHDKGTSISNISYQP